MTSIFQGRDQPVRPPGRSSSAIPTPVGATAVLDQRLRFTGWSREAEELFGLESEEVLGRPADAVLADTETGAGVSAAGGGGAAWSLGPRPVRRGDGRPVSVSLSLTPLALGAGATGWLLTAMDAELAHREAIGRAMLDGLDREAPVQLVVYDTDARVRWINAAIEKQFGIPLEDAADRFVKDILPQGEVLGETDGTATSVEEIVQRVARTGAPVIDVRYRSSTYLDPHHERVWSCSYFRLQHEHGRPIGVCEAALDITDRYVARRRLALLSRASGSIGRTLDIRRTAQDLAELVVPEFADAVTVDIVEAVLGGQEPQHFGTRPTLCRVAHRTDHAAAKDTAYDALDAVRLRCLAENAPATDAATHALALPLKARGATLGVVAFARSRHADPFEHEEIQLAEELVSRTAVCLDNARRYTREHATALTLQRDLLPRTLPQQPGVEVAHRYLPAAGPAGVGGDWYDVIPLSGARVGLVVGDVAGHGTGAAATMGRVRTTVAALAALDLAPDELLARLDDLVARTGAPAGPADAEDQALGVTCLYAIYDPVSRHCVMARAGHLPPVLVTPDGHAELVDLPAGPPLGLGGLPFECADIELPEGATLALYTDGLVENRHTDIDAGVSSLCTALAGPADGQLDKTCDKVITTLLPQPPEDDAALLLLRVHALADSLVATWDVASDPGEVARARSLACNQLAGWGVDEAASFVVELVVSELVTNAIRYGGAPVCLRLIRERGLIVEVSDGGHTSPHLRRAAMEDEGGRGLFVVAQLTQRWGTRYTPTGKIIWTEVSLAPPRLPGAFADEQLEL
ncbi:SpoIIE family protein phosphatase [Streptomyces scabiei]|uniref:protein-serine/threonine phosphatase n=1 Tax=Streptomyces scabiei TaxID=1930 RepID=A0A100JTM5_STRSC|nr:SpoIIE family protein phosphatase [Streptomyces scabiei]GAQ65471.1 phosphoserine phosphatase RsbP [Streptomyces scabiei]